MRYNSSGIMGLGMTMPTYRKREVKYKPNYSNNVPSVAIMDTIRDKKDNIIAYVVANRDGVTEKVNKDDFKMGLLNRNFNCFNAKITKDNRLMVTPREKAEKELINSILDDVNERYGDRIVTGVYCAKGAYFTDNDETKEHNGFKKVTNLNRQARADVSDYKFARTLWLPDVRVSLNKVINGLKARMPYSEYRSYDNTPYIEDIPQNRRTLVQNYYEIEKMCNNKIINVAYADNIVIIPGISIVANIGLHKITREVIYSNITYEVNSRDVIQDTKVDELNLNFGALIAKDEIRECLGTDELNEYAREILSKIEVKKLFCKGITKDSIGMAEKFSLVDRDGLGHTYNAHELNRLIKSGEAVCTNLPLGIDLTESKNIEIVSDVHNKVKETFFETVASFIDNPKSINMLGTKISEPGDYFHKKIANKNGMELYGASLTVKLPYFNNKVLANNVVYELELLSDTYGEIEKYLKMPTYEQLDVLHKHAEDEKNTGKSDVNIYLEVGLKYLIDSETKNVADTKVVRLDLRMGYNDKIDVANDIRLTNVFRAMLPDYWPKDIKNSNKKDTNSILKAASSNHIVYILRHFLDKSNSDCKNILSRYSDDTYHKRILDKNMERNGSISRNPSVQNIYNLLDEYQKSVNRMTDKVIESTQNIYDILKEREERNRLVNRALDSLDRPKTDAELEEMILNGIENIIDPNLKETFMEIYNNLKAGNKVAVEVSVYAEDK